MIDLLLYCFVLLMFVWFTYLVDCLHNSVQRILDILDIDGDGHDHRL